MAGFDATGVRATGSLHWAHTVSTQLLTWYYTHKRRRNAGAAARRARPAICSTAESAAPPHAMRREAPMKALASRRAH